MSGPGRGAGLSRAGVWFRVFALGGGGDDEHEDGFITDSVLRAVCILPPPARTCLHIPQINDAPPIRRVYSHTRHGQLCAIHLTRLLCASLPPSVFVPRSERPCPRMVPSRRRSSDDASHRVINLESGWESRFGRGVGSVGEFGMGGGVCRLGTPLDFGGHVDAGEEGGGMKKIETR